MTDRPVEVELRRVRLALRRPHVAASGAEVDRQLVIVKVVLAGGAVGWGECSALSRPTYTAEYTAGAWALLRDELAPAALAGRSSGVVGHRMAAAALVDALLDAALRREGRSLASALGATTDRVPITTVVGIASSIDELLAEVDGVAGGVKLKIRPGWDVEPLAAVRASWPDRWLAADANGSFSAAEPGPLLALDEFGLAYVEQPVTGLMDAARLAGRIGTPICLDEAIASADAAAAAIALSAMAVVNVKPARLGGVRAAQRVIAIAADAGVGAFVGGMLESGVGRASAAAVAALPGCSLPTDLGPSSRYFERDLTQEVEAAGGSLLVPTGAGIGVAPDPGRLDAATTEQLVLRT